MQLSKKKKNNWGDDTENKEREVSFNATVLYKIGLWHP